MWIALAIDRKKAEESWKKTRKKISDMCQNSLVCFIANIVYKSHLDSRGGWGLFPTLAYTSNAFYKSTYKYYNPDWILFYSSQESCK